MGVQGVPEGGVHRWGLKDLVVWWSKVELGRKDHLRYRGNTLRLHGERNERNLISVHRLPEVSETAITLGSSRSRMLISHLKPSQALDRSSMSFLDLNFRFLFRGSLACFPRFVNFANLPSPSFPTLGKSQNYFQNYALPRGSG